MTKLLHRERQEKINLSFKPMEGADFQENKLKNFLKICPKQSNCVKNCQNCQNVPQILFELCHSLNYKNFVEFVQYL
jgi:hypothetical protein